MSTNNLPKKSIIFCLPATDARVGLPFAGAQAMSAAATLRGAEVLRREIRLAALTDESQSMRHIKVVTVDVGSVGASSEKTQTQSVEHSMLDWTVSEKAAYGSAFASVSQGQTHLRRKPTEVAKFSQTVVDVVSGGRIKTPHRFQEIDLVLGRLREFIWGDRVIVGAGGMSWLLHTLHTC